MCPGIALYPGQAQLLSCKHYYEVIPPLTSPGQPGDMDCTTQRINYTHPLSNQTVVTSTPTLCPEGPLSFCEAFSPLRAWELGDDAHWVLCECGDSWQWDEPNARTEGVAAVTQRCVSPAWPLGRIGYFLEP